MSATFLQMVGRLLTHEGGYVNDPQDPGGETNWGIAKRSYPDLDIRHLTRDKAVAIYKRDFWDKVQGDQLPPAVAFQLFDAAVNHGIGNAVRWLQAAARVKVDGQLGPATMAAVRSQATTDLLLRFNAARLDFYTNLPTSSGSAPTPTPSNAASSRFDLWGEPWTSR